MIEKFEYFGKIDNWMDFRDELLKYMKDCDTEIKFNKLISSIILSFNISPEQLIQTRKQLGVKTNLKDKRRLKKWYKEEQKCLR